jgi:Cu+-exporting ATPase
MDSSNVILMKNDLDKILDLINISKHTIQNIKQNLFWAFFYNSLMIPIAIGVFHPLGIYINPMMASFAMVISSLTVILNTLRLKRLERKS